MGEEEESSCPCVECEVLSELLVHRDPLMSTMLNSVIKSIYDFLLKDYPWVTIMLKSFDKDFTVRM